MTHNADMILRLLARSLCQGAKSLGRTNWTASGIPAICAGIGNIFVFILSMDICDCVKHLRPKLHINAELPCFAMEVVLDTEMVKANNDAAVWLIDGYEPTANNAAAGAFCNGE